MQRKIVIVAAIIVVAIVAIGAAFLLGVGGVKKGVVGESKAIKVGVILPLTGRLAETGEDLKRGIEFAVHQINSMGGVKNCGGAKIVVVWGDSQARPERGAAEAERLIVEEHVVALVGAYQSAVTKTASEVAERYHVPFLNPDSTSPTLTERGYKWFFRVTPHDGMFAKQQVEFVNWLNQKCGGCIKKIAIIHEDSEWGTSVARQWEKEFSAAGYEIVDVISYHAPTVTSFDAEVEKLKKDKPDLLLVASYVHDALLLMKTIKTKKLYVKAILAQDAGFISPAYVSQVGDAGWFVFSREVFNWDLAQKIAKLEKVEEEYKKTYGVSLNGNSARDYTGMWVLYYALENACKVAKPWEDLQEFRKALRDALANLYIPGDELIMPWKGVKFDEKGQNILGQGIIVQMMEDGKYYTVYPPEFATKEPVFPMPSWEERSK